MNELVLIETVHYRQILKRAHKGLTRPFPKVFLRFGEVAAERGFPIGRQYERFRQ